MIAGGGARRTARTAFAIAAVALGAACATSCQDGAGAPDAGPSDASPFGDGASGFGFVCGGTSDVAGAGPGASAFSGTLVRATVLGSGCNDPAGSVTLVFRDPQTRAQLSLTVTSSGDAGSATPVGTHALAGAFSAPEGAPVSTTGTLVVTAADDARAVLTGDGGPAGSIQGTVSFTRDGLALSGAFSTPYCQASSCLGH